MALHADRQLRLRHQAHARAAIARDARLVAVARGGVPVNNWILLFAAFFMLFATMFPTLSEALSPASASRWRPPFFNKWMVPIGLMLLFLTGVGPLIAWRKATPSNLAPCATSSLLARVGLHARSTRHRLAARDAALGRWCWRELLLRSSRRSKPAGDLLRLLRLRDRHHHAGVRARHRHPQAQHRAGRACRRSWAWSCAASAATAATSSTSASC